MRKIGHLFLMVVVVVFVAACSGAKSQLAKGRKAYNQQDYHASVSALSKSARAGNADAQYALGYMYFYGKGIDQDSQTARYWINQAASQGHPQAIRALRLIQQHKASAASQSRIAEVKNNQPRIIRATTTQTTSAATVPPRRVVLKKSRPQSPAKAPSKVTDAQLSVSERQLMEVPSKYYTLQIMGSSSQSDLEQVVSQNALTGKAAYYRTTRKGSPWYVLIYGQYNNYHNALVALRTMPKAIRHYKPWINSFARVKQAIKSRHL